MSAKTTLVGILAIGGLAAAVWLQHGSVVQLKVENQSLRAQLEEAGQLAAENERLSNLVAQAGDSPGNDQQHELLRLRGEVGMLRNQTNQMARQLREGNQRLEAAMQARATPAAQTPEEADPAAAQAKQQGIAKLNDARSLVYGLIMAAQANQGRVDNLAQAAPYVRANPEMALTGTNQFELVYQGLLGDISNPASAVVVRETQAAQAPNGTWFRAYGFADGHSEIHTAADGNFGAWEQQHVAVARAAAQ